MSSIHTFPYKLEIRENIPAGLTQSKLPTHITGKKKSHVLFNVASCCHFQACLSISARENDGMCKYVCGVGTHRYSTMFMTSSARLPWLTALVLLQSQLETPRRKRLSCNEPPRRMQLINSVYFWTKFVCTRRGLCLYMCVLSVYLLS